MNYTPSSNPRSAPKAHCNRFSSISWSPLPGTAPAETYLDILDNPDLTAKLDRLARHQTRIERSFHRSLRELKALQTDAALAPTLPPVFMHRVQPLPSKTQIAKRTQALAIADRLNGVEEEYWSGADAEAGALRSALENNLIVSNGSTPL